MPLERNKAVITDFGWVVEMPTQRYVFLWKKNKLGAWIFLEIRRDRQNTPGILIQDLDLSPNKQELLKESKT
jgi:hypothetical protein